MKPLVPISTSEITLHIITQCLINAAAFTMRHGLVIWTTLSYQISSEGLKAIRLVE
jgi:hypothetical protein